MAPNTLKTTSNEPELLSVSEIARRCGIHRTTTVDRLEDLGYEPDPSSTSNLKLYPFDGEMMFAVKAAKDPSAAYKLRDLRATYELKELKLAEARRELVPMNEMIDIAQRLTSAIYQEFAVRRPKRIAGALAKAKTVAAVTAILKADTDRVMKRLRENFEEFLK